MASTRTSTRKAGNRRREKSHAAAIGVALTIVEARAGQRTLAKLLAGGRGELDASGLRSVDTAGLQLLLAAGRAARARGLALTIRGAAPLLREAARSLGLEGALTEVVELTP